MDPELDYYDAGFNPFAEKTPEHAFEPELRPEDDKDWLARHPDYDPLENYPPDPPGEFPSYCY